MTDLLTATGRLPGLRPDPHRPAGPSYPKHADEVAP